MAVSVDTPGQYQIDLIAQVGFALQVNPVFIDVVIVFMHAVYCALCFGTGEQCVSTISKVLFLSQTGIVLQLQDYQIVNYLQLGHRL